MCKKDAVHAGLLALFSLILVLSGCGGGSSSNFVSSQMPSIATQPVGPIISSGQTASLTVTASGTGTLAYQWYQGPSGTTSNPIAGATSSSYTTPSLTATTSYWVKVSDSEGSANSITAVVLIAGPRQVQALVYTTQSSGGLTIQIPGTFMANVLPNISGVSVSMPWNAIESTDSTGIHSGGYDFTSFDAILQPFVNAGRAVNLIVWPATEGGNNEIGSGGSTPAYVLSAGYASTLGVAPQDMSVCQSYQGDSGSPYASLGSTVWNSDNTTYGSDLSGLPVSYEAPFMTAYQAFIAKVIQHYNGNQQTPIGYIRFGFSQGGENSPECNTVWPQASPALFPGCTISDFKSGYLCYVGAMTDFIKAQNPSVTILGDLHAVGPPGSVDYGYADTEAADSVAAGFGFGTNGLQVSDIASLQSQLPCDSDWCNMFALYSNQKFKGNPITLSLQTLQWTDPTGEDSTNPTGSFTLLEPFAKTNAANNLELYQADVGLAFDSANYCSYPHAACPAVNASTYSSSYASAIQDFMSSAP
jgi:hypothetical protein